MRRATVLATVVLALGALGAPAMAVAPDAVPDEGAASLDRIAGDTRFDTAALTALRAHPDGADTVLIATGLNFPDALAASFLAGGATQAPILLVERENVPAETTDALETLDPSNIIVLGGDDAIADETVQALADAHAAAEVDVIAGATRIETAAMIARRGGTIGTAPNLTDEAADEELTTAIVARAGDFPDALSSGPLALAGRHPILLTPTDTLDETTRDVLTDADLGIEQVILAGGTVAISEDVEQEIADLDSITSVERVAGENRTATAVRLADLTRDVLDWDGSNVALARGDFFPDALTVAPLAAQNNASLFLSRNPETIEGDTFEGLQALCAETTDLLVTGGTAAVSADAAGEAKLATICADHTFPISGEQEVDEGDEDAAGTGWVTVVDDTVCTAYDVEGLDGEANASHIHQGVPGTAGDPVIDLGAPNVNGFLADCTADADVAAGITANPIAYYVNIHTPDFPQGAARGQLEGTEDIEVALEGETEVQQDADGNDTGFADEPSDASGTLDLFLGEGELCYEVTVSGLASPVDTSLAGGFHIHEGAFNANRPIVLPLPQEQSATDYTGYDCVEADQALLDDIAANPQNYYANLHTVDGADPDVPANGTLRGQLGADAETALFADAVVDTSTPTEPAFGGGPVEDLTVPVRLFTPDADTLCIDAEVPADAGTVDSLTLLTGQVDENDAVPADDVTFPDALECVTGPEATAAIGELEAGTPAKYVSLSLDGSQAARGQVTADALTVLTPAAENGDPTAIGVAALYDGANADVLCGAIDVTGADTVSDVSVTAADAEIANLDITDPVGFGCDTDATDAEAEAIIVTTGGGALTGQFVAEA